MLPLQMGGMKDLWGNNQEQAKQKETSRWGSGDPLSVVSHSAIPRNEAVSVSTQVQQYCENDVVPFRQRQMLLSVLIGSTFLKRVSVPCEPQIDLWD